MLYVQDYGAPSAPTRCRAPERISAIVVQTQCLRRGSPTHFWKPPFKEYWQHPDAREA